MNKQEPTQFFLIWKRYCFLLVFFLVFSLFLATSPFVFLSLRFQDLLYQIPGKPFSELYIIPAAQPMNSADQISAKV